MFAVKNWQTTRPTIRERSKFMFNNDIFSDVKFVVQKADQGESESKQVIPAHKFVLSISSPVFEAMFYGELAETKDSIELPDCEYESLLELFRYMYSDEVILSGSNVMGVLYLAKKYIVPSLADKCTEFLKENLDPSNVFSILPSAQKYQEKNLVDQCWKVIDEQTEEAVKSDEFATIERSLLEAVVERDTLGISEVELFKAVMQWATKESETQGLVADGQIKRRILGEKIVKGLRFPVMTNEEFTSVVTDSKLLTLDEVSDMFKWFAVKGAQVGFPVSKRGATMASSGLERCFRFGSVVPGWSNDTSRLIFSVNKNILLHGVYLFGGEGSYLYLLNLMIYHLPDDALVASTKGIFASLPNKSRNYWGFDVLLDAPVSIMKSIRYGIIAEIGGPDSFGGWNGNSHVESSGVTFKFKDWFGTTGVEQGQLPEIIFSLQE